MGLKNDRLAVITGIGVVSPVGIGKEKFWSALVEGKSGVNRISQFDPSTYPCQHAAEVMDYANQRLSPLERKLMPRGSKFALTALAEAMQDCGLDSFEPYSTGVVVGAGHISFQELESEMSDRKDLLQYKESFSVKTLFGTMMSMPTSVLCNKTGAQGYYSTKSSACASGIDAVIEAANLIRNSQCDIVVVCGVDTPINNLTLNAFLKLQNLPVGYDYGKSMELMRPFDEKRTKSFLGEGATVCIIESLEHAVSRSAKIYCEIKQGFLTAENVNYLFKPELTASKWSTLIERTLEGRKKVSVINAHGPSDLMIDALECKALDNFFGKALGKIPITSIKGSVAGGMAAASAAQVAASAMMVKQQTIPPISNYSTSDEALSNLKFVKRAARLDISNVLINARGVGGVLAALELGRLQ